ncbi:MAG TPA: hypothetical protein VK501_05480 [Baekduia sp.]|nr:hypothetical protein [Baekduia sp.]
MVGEALGSDLGRAVVVAGGERGPRRVPVLERRHGQCRARAAADHEYRRLGLGGDGLARDAGRDEHERADWRVARLAVDRERCPTRRDEVELLMASGVGAVLVVALDDLVAGRDAGVAVDAERRDAERAPHRPPDQAVAVETVDVVKVGGGEAHVIGFRGSRVRPAGARKQKPPVGVHHAGPLTGSGRRPRTTCSKAARDRSRCSSQQEPRR